MDLLLELKEVIAKLRDPEVGCPWDLLQDHHTLRQFLIEETYETIHAINSEDFESLREELGDVLLQIFLHAQIASEKKHFNIEDIFKDLKDKMIRRHPHVFEREKFDSRPTIDQLHENWKKTKILEGKKTDGDNPIKQKDLNLSPLISADKIGERTNKVGFDWDHPEDVLKKVYEELEEVSEAIDQNDLFKIEEELGDLLFSTTQLIRKLNLNPEITLQKANQKFYNRFSKMWQDNSDFCNLSSEQKEMAWQRVKDAEDL